MTIMDGLDAVYKPSNTRLASSYREEGLWRLLASKDISGCKKAIRMIFCKKVFVFQPLYLYNS